MNTYTPEFYDLLSKALGGNDGARLQGFLDDTMAQKYSQLQLDGFSFRPDMQLEFTYEQVVKELGLDLMANYYDLDSPAIPTSTEGAESYTGSIPRMKAVEYWNEDKYRKLLIAEKFNDNDARMGAYRGLFNTVDTLIGQHTNSLTFQRHQMVSKAALDINANNNPLGVSLPTLSAHVPAANKETLKGEKRWWKNVTDGIYSGEGNACDPIADLQAIVKKARFKGVRGHFEVDTTYFDQILSHSKVIAALKDYFAINGNNGVTVANVNLFSRANRAAALAAIVGAEIKEIDSLVATEKWDAAAGKIVRNQFSAFESNVLVFVPDGNIGEVITVRPLVVAGGTYASFYGGRLLLTVGVDYVKKCQSFNTEMTSLVVPDKPQYMWYLHPYGAQ